MEAKHTKEPWLITTIQGEDCLMIGGGDGSEVVADIRTHWPEEEVEANARLIAAAPELLQIAEDYVLLCELIYWEGSVLDAAREAIAKVKGGK
jgi:hypothetical protein